MEETGKNPIQVAERLFQVIERLAENGPMGIMDLSAELGFHKSTTHRLVTSLQYMGYIRQDEESLKYALSLKFLEIGSKILEQTNMASLIHPSLKKRGALGSRLPRQQPQKLLRHGCLMHGVVQLT